jgi:hypothetical protein
MPAVARFASQVGTAALRPAQGRLSCRLQATRPARSAKTGNLTLGGSASHRDRRVRLGSACGGGDSDCLPVAEALSAGREEGLLFPATVPLPPRSSGSAVGPTFRSPPPAALRQIYFPIRGPRSHYNSSAVVPSPAKFGRRLAEPIHPAGKERFSCGSRMYNGRLINDSFALGERAEYAARPAQSQTPQPRAAGVSQCKRG